MKFGCTDEHKCYIVCNRAGILKRVLTYLHLLVHIIKKMNISSLLWQPFVKRALGNTKQTSEQRPNAQDRLFVEVLKLFIPRPWSMTVLHITVRLQTFPTARMVGQEQPRETRAPKLDDADPSAAEIQLLPSAHSRFWYWNTLPITNQLRSIPRIQRLPVAPIYSQSS